MNEYKQQSLYDVFDKFTTDKLQCYLLACQENKYDTVPKPQHFTSTIYQRRIIMSILTIKFDEMFQNDL